jgi:pyridoxal 5'-phosphate synthase pdxT subunit
VTSVTTVGVLALQGGVREHRLLLEHLGATTVTIRSERDLRGADGPRVDGLVLPGGESSTIDRLLRLYDLAEPLRETIAAGVPTLGTCAGLVLLANEVLDPAPGQQSLGLLDVSVRRNALGRQVDSAEVDLETVLGAVRVAFIRAPVVVRVGEGVEVLARRDDAVVGVRAGGITGVSFHPELTGDETFHRALLQSSPPATEADGAPSSTGASPRGRAVRGPAGPLA